MTSDEIQEHFPHVCVGYGCAVCWWVDGRNAEQAERRAQLLARMDRILGTPGARASADAFRDATR